MIAALARALRQDLAGYSAETVAEFLGEEAAAAMAREQRVPALLRCRAASCPLAARIRLLRLGEALTDKDASAALPATMADTHARDVLLVRTHAGISARFQIVAQEDGLLLASDLGELAGKVPNSQYVMPVGGATRTLARLVTYRGRVLDVGTGNGALALRAARTGHNVVGTDISTRALRFASLNAALNGVEVDLRGGSLFAPVEGPAGAEKFDTIVSNPPFVITPQALRADGLLEYRDGGMKGDELFATLLRSLPAHLAPGGRAYVLGNWEVRDGEAWDERPRAWLADLGLDAWIIGRDEISPARYAEMWLRDGGLTPHSAGYETAYSAWLADFERRGVASISLGYLVMGLAAGAPVIRTERITEPVTGALREFVDTAWKGLHYRELDNAALEARVFTQHGALEQRVYMPGAPDPFQIALTQTAGFQRSLPVNSNLAALIGACDGELTLGELIGGLASILEEEPAAISADIMPGFREALARGIVVEASENARE